MLTAELLRKKRDGNALTAEEIRFLIAGLQNGAVSEPQAAGFLMASCTRGLSPVETTALTFAMADSGTTFDFRSVGKPVVDKHSTGGVGDKLSLLLAPLASACGLAVPMISGRGLGHTGGTVDKLESISGIKMDFSASEFFDLLRKNGVFMAKATADIAPADKTLYHLRDITGTVESVGLITASILSKKFAEGLDALVMDIKVGSGAFMPTFDSARELAESMMAVAREAGLTLRILFTSMNEPLGFAVGNWLEIEESERGLRGDCPPDIRFLTEKLCVSMLLAGKITDSPEKALEKVRKTWESGIASEKFSAMIAEQGGDLVLSQKIYAEIPRQAVLAEKDGVISAINGREIGIAGILLGAGRRKSDDEIDHSAGIIFRKKTGDEVGKGEEIAIVQARDAGKFPVAIQAIQQAITIGREIPKSIPLVLEEWS